ncbi:MAG TPA: DUF1697 domain-containing protein [Gammaproteobacteria bacterium]|jgi:uncharacterized protein (DUF1697 family)
MKTYIALFRGINIGGHHALPMKGLVQLLEELGCRDIRTYIQSGNVVFQTRKTKRARLARGIGIQVMNTYGFEPTVLLLEEAELREAIDNNPFPSDEGKALHLFFLDSPPEAPDLARLDAIKSGSEQFRLIKSIFYLFTPEGVGRSKLAANVEKCLGVPATGRNWNTVCKLLAMVEQR